MWLGDDRLVVSVEREDTSRLAVARRRRPLAAALCGSEPLGGDGAAAFRRHGDEWAAAVSPDGSRGRLRLHAPRRPAARRDPRRGRRDGRDLGARRGRRDRRRGPRRGRPTARRSRSRRSAAAGTRSTSSRPTGAASGSSPAARLTSRSTRGIPDGGRLVAVRCRRNRFDLVTVDAETGAVTVVAEGGAWGSAALDGRRRAARTLRGRRHGAGAPARRARARARARSMRPRRAPSARAPHVRPEDVTLHVVRRRRDPRLPVPAGRSLGGAAGARGRLPARRPDRRLRRRVGRSRAVLRRQGLRVARDQLPRLDRVRARLRAPEPRRLGRRRHEGLPRCGRLPAHARLGRRRPARHLRRELRLVHGAARGHRRSRAPLPLRRREVRRLRHPHLLGAGRPGGRPGHGADDGAPVPRPGRLRGRLAGAPARERRGAAPDRARRARRAGAARSSPRSSSQELRRLGGKTFEYVTYPTEGHGFLRVGPQLHFYRRLERFLDWYLM